VRMLGKFLNRFRADSQRSDIFNLAFFQHSYNVPRNLFSDCKNAFMADRRVWTHEHKMVGHVRDGTRHVRSGELLVPSILKIATRPPHNWEVRANETSNPVAQMIASNSTISLETNLIPWGTIFWMIYVARLIICLKLCRYLSTWIPLGSVTRLLVLVLEFPAGCLCCASLCSPLRLLCFIGVRIFCLLAQLHTRRHSVFVFMQLKHILAAAVSNQIWSIDSLSWQAFCIGFPLSRLPFAYDIEHTLGLHAIAQINMAWLQP
jgi:hypothetical protein